MYYKVLKDGRIIDILTNLVYLKYQPKHNIMVVCSEDEAQAFLSSDENYIWHTSELYNIPVNGYDCVELIEIDKYEYDSLKRFNLKTVEEIIDDYTMELINMGVL